MAIKAGRVGVDPSQVTLSGYIKGGGVSPEVLTKEEARRIYQTIMGMSEYLKKTDANSLYQKISDMVNYQAKLVSGQNIKRINGEDLLGSGNITVLTRTLADGIYQTIAGMSDYALKSEIPDLDDVVTKAEAPGYNDILTRTQAQLLYELDAGYGISIDNNIVANTGLDVTASSTRSLENVDLNTVITPGIYYVAASPAADAPSYNFPIGSNGTLIVVKVNASRVRQIFLRIGTIDSNDYQWYSREIGGSLIGEWIYILNAKNAWLHAGSSISTSTSSTAPIVMSGYIGSSGTALNLTLPLGRHITATSVAASTLRVSAYSATERLILASEANDLITGNVYSCTLALNNECDTIMLHIVKNDGTAFGTNATAITGALSAGSFTFS